MQNSGICRNNGNERGRHYLGLSLWDVGAGQKTCFTGIWCVDIYIYMYIWIMSIII